MTDFERHIGDVYQTLRTDHGEFDFFALLEPVEALGTWDLMMSAPWLTNTLDGLGLITKAARKHLTKWDWRSFGHMVIRPKDYDGIPELAAEQPPAVELPATVGNVEIGGAPIRQAVIFKLPSAPPRRKRPAKRRRAAAAAARR